MQWIELIHVFPLYYSMDTWIVNTSFTFLIFFSVTKEWTLFVLTSQIYLVFSYSTTEKTLIVYII